MGYKEEFSYKSRIYINAIDCINYLFLGGNLMKTMKKNLSKLIAVLFIFTLFPHFGILAKADNITLPAADTAVTLVGNFINGSGLGNDWDPTNAQSLMQEYKNGLYEFSVNFT